MTNEEKTEMFEHMPVPEAVMKLAVPTVIGCLVMILYNLADTYFVGQINSPVQNAAVTLVAPVILAFNAINNLFGVGGSSMMSRALGVKDMDTVRRSSVFSFYGALICGFLLSIFAVIFHDPLLHLLGASNETYAATGKYLFWTVIMGAVPSILNVVMGNLVRAEGNALNATIGTMSGCLLNVVLDPVFILPEFLDMGAAGAGVATFISNTVACLYFFIFLYIKRNDTYVSIRFSRKCLNKVIIFGVLGVGVPAAVQNLLNVTGMTILNNFTVPFGSEAVAAMGISHKITMIPMYVSMGIAQGVLPLIGYNYAARNGKRFKETIMYTIKVSGVLIVVAAAGFYVFSGNIMRVFMKNALTVKYGTAFMHGMSLAQPFLAMDFMAVGIFQACGMGRRSFIFSIMRKGILEIPALMVLNHFYPMYGLAYAQLVAEVILALASIFYICKIFNEFKDRDNSTEQSLL